MLETKKPEDFRELKANFLPEQALLEAERCLYCFDAPCISGCPVSVDIPNFIQSVRSGNLKRAAKIINDSNPFGSVCGRVCPVERLCEKQCAVGRINGKPVQIAMLQRYASDYGGYKRPAVEKKGRKVAVVGSGPSGLACASELARNGISVTVFESKNRAGGMVAFGVPQYRCPHSVTEKEVENIISEGVEIRTATPVNRDVSTLFDLGFEAVYIAVGLTKTSRPDIPGLELKGVYMGLDYLNRIGAGDKVETGKKVVVIGGGDTALDCARSALRLGAEEVTLLYRRSFTELPADKAEIEEALEEGVIFRTLSQPVALFGDEENVLRAMEVVNVKLGPPDASGRRKPVEIKGSNYRLACNTCIFATGTEPSKLLKKVLPDVDYIKDIYPKVDPETFSTSIPGIFCGGDVVNKGKTVVQAIAEGKKAAQGILKYLDLKGEPSAIENVIPEEAPDVEVIEKEKHDISSKLEKAIEEAEEAIEKADMTLKSIEIENAIKTGSEEQMTENG